MFDVMAKVSIRHQLAQAAKKALAARRIRLVAVRFPKGAVVQTETSGSRNLRQRAARGDHRRR
jgi:hypothetical protein